MIIKEKNIFKPNTTYLDIRRVYKFYPDALLSVIYGVGGIGKTETCRRYLHNLYKKQIKAIERKIWDYNELLQYKIKIKNKFLWLNRTQQEVDDKKKDLFKDYGWTSIGEGNNIQIQLRLTYETKEGKLKDVNYALELGKFEAINNASKVRGGNSFKEFNTIVWDEFMDEHDKYLPNEMKKVKSIITTAMRSKKNVRWIFMSNTVDKDAEVFKKLNFNPASLKKNQQGWVPENKTLFYYIGQNNNFEKEYEDSAIMTVFGKEDEYIKYRVGAEFVANDDQFVERELDRQHPLKPKFNIVYLGNTFGVYEYKKRGLYFSYNKISGKNPKTYPLTKNDAVKINQVFRNTDTLNNWFYSLMRKGIIYFEDGTIKDIVLTFISKGR